MLVDITEVKALPNWHLFLKFEDGTEGTIDLARHIQFTGVFKELKNETYFKKVSVNSELGTISWPNGADLDPDVLYSLVKGEPTLNFSKY